MGLARVPESKRSECPLKGSNKLKISVGKRLIAKQAAQKAAHYPLVLQ